MVGKVLMVAIFSKRQTGTINHLKLIKKIVDLQAHNASHCNAQIYRACRSAISESFDNFFDISLFMLLDVYIRGAIIMINIYVRSKI